MKRNLLLTIIFCTILTHSYSQTCTGCTQTISTNSFTPIVANSGDVVCVNAGVTVNASVNINGGMVCNLGTITGNLSMTGGRLDNYNLLNASSMSINGGVLNNQDSIISSSLFIQGGNTYVLNGGIFTGSSASMQKTSAGTVTFDNNGTFNVSSWNMDHVNFNNNGVMNVTTGFSSLDSSVFHNTGGLHVGSFNTDAYFYTNCMVKVNGNWSSSGVIEGPTVGCGGFSVIGNASNSGVFGYNNSNLDMCDSANVGSFTSNSGTLGTNVSYCTCNSICSMSIGIEDVSDNNSMHIYPNPAGQIAYLEFEKKSNANYKLLLFDCYGRLKQTINNITTNKVVIERQNMASGLYFFQLQTDNKIIGSGKLTFE